jgi:hypothetical protein
LEGERQGRLERKEGERERERKREAKNAPVAKQHFVVVPGRPAHHARLVKLAIFAGSKSESFFLFLLFVILHFLWL